MNRTWNIEIEQLEDWIDLIKGGEETIVIKQIKDILNHGLLDPYYDENRADEMLPIFEDKENQLIEIGKTSYKNGYIREDLYYYSNKFILRDENEYTIVEDEVAF